MIYRNIYGDLIQVVHICTTIHTENHRVGGVLQSFLVQLSICFSNFLVQYTLPIVIHWIRSENQIRIRSKDHSVNTEK